MPVLNPDRTPIAAALQRKLVLDDKPSIVLSTVEMARQLLPGHGEDDILMLIEEGFLAHAWNIALRDDAAREIRIYPDCLAWYARTHGKGQYSPGGGRRDGSPSPGGEGRGEGELAVLSDLLRNNGDKPFIKGSTLRLILNCSATHLINLVDAKQLSLQPGTNYARPFTPLVSVASLKSFLKSRRLP